MKLSRLEYTKKLYPHWLDRNDGSNFVKHLKIVNNQQIDVYHKLKTLDWARMLEKPIQIWKVQEEPYNYVINFKVSIPFIKEINIYKNPKINKKGLVDGYDELILHKYYQNDDVNIFEYSHSDTSGLIIPRDTFIIEVYTWDDYHFIKGFPENDYLFYNELDYKFNESFLKINLEEISYTKYLTFRVHMDYIKLVEIFKNEKRIYIEDFILEGFNNRRLYSTDFSYQYFDYTDYESFEDVYEIESMGSNSKVIYRANIEKDEYVFRLPLKDEDFEIIFDYGLLVDNYPNTEEYIISYDEIDPSEETFGTIVILKENDVYNAYETLFDDEEYSFNLVQQNVNYVLGSLKDNYDLFVTVSERRTKCGKMDFIDFSDILSKNYTIEGCLDTIYSEDDCVIVNQLPTPSITTFGSLLIVKEDGVYKGYKTLLNEETGNYYYSLLLDNIDYTTINSDEEFYDEDIIDFGLLLENTLTTDGYLNKIYELKDCQIVKVLPKPSIYTCGKLLFFKQNEKYVGYKTIFDRLSNEYTYHLLVDDVEYSTLRLPKGKVYKKRYSGYDDILGDCFDHDYSLDMIGHLYNIRRYKFKPIPHKNPYYYSKTYPKYNNRYTEDDYHYMKRIQYYIQNYNQITFPVLEFWKYYYTDSRLENRKAHLGVQDRYYLRTNYDSTCLDEDGHIINTAEILIDEEFDDNLTITDYEDIELITDSTSSEYRNNSVYYNVNKATIIKGYSNPINITGYDTVWYEAVIVNNVFVVPNNNYRLRYGIAENSKPVTIRMICHNRKGQKLHSIPITDESDDLNDDDYPTSEGFEYIDKIITIPSDTAYIQIVLESDDSFEFSDITFQRETVAGYDNKYMKSSRNWNSCVYDLYVNYDDIPVNLKLDDSYTFNLLFKRSLPVTKIGYLNVSMENGSNNYLGISTSSSIEILDYFGNYDEYLTGHSEYNFIIEDYFEAETQYIVRFYCKTIHSGEDNVGDEENYLISSKFKFYDENFNQIDIYEMPDEVDSEIEAKVNYVFLTPPGTQKGELIIESNKKFDCWDVSLMKYDGEQRNG